MLILVTYDISTKEDGGGRLNRVAEICSNYGIRAQNSIFECRVAPDELVELRDRLTSAMDERYDSIRLYFLGSGDRHKYEHYGINKPLNLEKDTIIY